MKLTNKDLRELILKEAESIGLPLGSSHRSKDKKHSEMKEFSLTKSGKKVAECGRKISSAGNLIKETAENQTGDMSATLHEIAGFVTKLGSTLESLQSLDENSSISDELPTLQEYKKLTKSIKKLDN